MDRMAVRRWKMQFLMDFSGFMAKTGLFRRSASLFGVKDTFYLGKRSLFCRTDMFFCRQTTLVCRQPSLFGVWTMLFGDKPYLFIRQAVCPCGQNTWRNGWGTSADGQATQLCAWAIFF